MDQNREAGRNFSFIYLKLGVFISKKFPSFFLDFWHLEVVGLTDFWLISYGCVVFDQSHLFNPKVVVIFMTIVCPHLNTVRSNKLWDYAERSPWQLWNIYFAKWEEEPKSSWIDNPHTSAATTVEEVIPAVMSSSGRNQI